LYQHSYETLTSNAGNQGRFAVFVRFAQALKIGPAISFPLHELLRS
jgi:hypothetical protein